MTIDLDFGVTQNDSLSVTFQYKLQRQYLTKPSFFLSRVMTGSERLLCVSYITPAMFYKLSMLCVDVPSCPT
jgi:hypothetical protein